jgi:hypothetical protein
MAFRTTKKLDTEFGIEAKSPDLGVGSFEDNDAEHPAAAGQRFASFPATAAANKDPNTGDLRTRETRNIQTDLATNEESAENRATR